MAKLVLLRGNSGSGKTSAAKALQEKFGPNTMLISHDMIRLQILNVSGALGRERSLPLMIGLMQYGRRHSEVTILEGILPAADYAPLFEACMESYGSEIFAYYWDVSFEETMRRHATKPNRGDFGEDDMRRWWKDKDYLKSISETMITETMSLDEAVGRIYRDVTAVR